MDKGNRSHLENILVVDDESIIREVLVTYLSEAGYQIHSAESGESALNILQQKLPDLILLDFNMPDMNGVEVCRRLKENPATCEIPVMFISGLGGVELKVQALESGAIDYITKPISLPELLIKIKNHLQLYHLQNRLKEEIEERKQVEKRLQESNERFKVAFDSSSDCILIWDEQYNYLYANQAAIDHVGTTADKVIAKNIRDGLGHMPVFMQLWMDRIDQGFATGKVFQYKDSTTISGRQYLTESTVSPLPDSDGKIMAVCVVYRDITKQRKMEEELFLNEKLKTIAGLAAGVAHEINTPLSAILQAHQLVEMGLSPSESKEKAAEYGVNLVAVQNYFQENELGIFMDGIRASAIKAGDIIKRLLDFSRPHEGSFSMANLKEIMENSLLLSQADYGMKKKYAIADVQIIKEYAPDLLPLACVPTEIEQVILNLIKNSVISMATADMTEKPRITLRISTTADMAVIEVADNGPGIPEDIRRNIFDPFFTTRDVGIGTGLGLSVSYAIVVDKHNGTIRVESEPGQGATFIVEIPLTREM